MQRTVAALLLLLACMASSNLYAQNAALLPKWGRTSSDAALSAEEQQFLSDADRRYKSDRPKASAAIATDGWKLLRQGKDDEAMQRFNQAWLLLEGNGQALWGMGQIQANRGQATDSLKLFGEANRLIGFDLDFGVDYARALSLTGAKMGDKKLQDQAFKRFAQIQARAPQNTLNLQNWAIAFFYNGQYASAWEKIKAAQATQHGAEVDKKFLADLQAKMPRP